MTIPRSLQLFGLRVHRERIGQVLAVAITALCIWASFTYLKLAVAIGITVFVTIALVAFLIVLSVRIRRRNSIEEIRALREGKPSFYTDELLSRYAYLIDRFPDARTIDPGTAKDLDLTQLHEASNATLTLAGEVLLYAMLVHPASTARIPAARSQVLDRLTDGDHEELLRKLHRVGRDDSADVVEMLFGANPAIDPRYPYYIVQSITTVILIGLLIAGVYYALLPLVLMVILNGFTYFRSAIAFTDLIPRFNTLIRMIEATEACSAMDMFSALDTCKAPKRNASMRRLIKAARFLAYSPGEGGDILGLFILIPKAFLLVDALVYHRLATLVQKNLEALRSVYMYVGTVDALQACAVYRSSLPGYCLAAIHHSTDIHGVDAYHPLLHDAVSNTFEIGAPGMIITGANMSGKSTFLRTVLVNVILSNSFGFACASSFSCGSYRVASLIRKSDSIKDGASLYFFEAQRIIEMIHTAQKGEILLLAVDEFFSGTNTRERIAAAVAVLRYLERLGCVTIAATHDVDVALSLADTYTRSYFADEFVGGEIKFDYSIRDGIVQSTNGLRLLRAIGYPDELVTLAEHMESRSP